MYLPPKPDVPSRGTWASNAQGRRYGFRTFGDYFTSRQLVALTMFSDLVTDVREKIRQDALAVGMADDKNGLVAGGTEARAYAEAVGVYLGCGISRAADYWNSIATWEPGGGFVAHAFTRQAVPMVWDFAESNPFSDSSGNWSATCIKWIEVGYPLHSGDPNILWFGLTGFRRPNRQRSSDTGLGQRPQPVAPAGRRACRGCVSCAG